MLLEKKLQDIKKYISLKNATYTGDILLVGTPDGIYYATVHDIKPDIKKNWYIVRFTLLVLPPVELTWTLREPQMCGEIFTINDEEHFMAAIELESGSADNPPSDRGTNHEQSGKVLQFLQKKQDD
jgi:hypothetical protein